MKFKSNKISKFFIHLSHPLEHTQNHLTRFYENIFKLSPDVCEKNAWRDFLLTIALKCTSKIQKSFSFAHWRVWKFSRDVQELKKVLNYTRKKLHLTNFLTHVPLRLIYMIFSASEINMSNWFRLRGLIPFNLPHRQFPKLITLQFSSIWNLIIRAILRVIY